MQHQASYHTFLTVDNIPKQPHEYTRRERSNGGKSKAAKLRFLNRFRDKAILDLYASLQSLRKVASIFHVSHVTVWKLVNGLQRRCLTAAETAKQPWATVLTLLFLRIPKIENVETDYSHWRSEREESERAWRHNCGFKAPKDQVCPMCGYEDVRARCQEDQRILERAIEEKPWYADALPQGTFVWL